MPLLMLGDERESLTLRSESFKQLVREYLLARGFHLELDSGIEGCFPDLGGHDSAGRKTFVEVKDTEVGMKDIDEFLKPFGKYLLIYINEPFKLVFAVRKLRTVRKFKETFDDMAINDVVTLRELRQHIADAFRRTGDEDHARRIENVDIDVLKRLVQDTEIVSGRHVEWAVQQKTKSAGPSEPAESASPKTKTSRCGEIDSIWEVKDDATRRTIILDCLGGPEGTGLDTALAVLDRVFPDDHEIASAVIEGLDKWSDQTVSDALFLYLRHTSHNRLPDAVLKVCINPKRGKPFRHEYLDLLGNVGRADQLAKLQEWHNRERNETIRGRLGDAIAAIRRRSPNALELRVKAELEEVREKLTSPGYPPVDLEVLSELISSALFGQVQPELQKQIVQVQLMMRKYNEIRQEAGRYVQVFPPLPPPLPLMGILFEQFVKKLEREKQSLLSLVNSVLACL